MAERVPILVKFPTALLARIEAKAASAKTNRMAMIIGLVERGLAEPPAAPPPTPKPPPKPVAPTVADAPLRRPFKSRLKGDWKAP